MPDTCQSCGQPMPAAFDPLAAMPEQIARVRAAARAEGIKEAPGGFYTEVGAAALLGLTPSGLRKQVAESRNRMDFVLRGNRRFYAVEQLALFF